MHTYTYAMRKFHVISAICFIVFIAGCKTHYQLAGKAYTLIEAPSSLERGKNLVQNICADCHYNAAAGKYIGMPFSGMPAIGGKVFAANLTSSKTFGVTARYTNAELAYLLKTGITRDGRFIPWMLRPAMAGDDVNDIIVYLRSADPAVAPGDTTVGHTHLNVIGRLIAHKLAKPQPYLADIKRPGKEDDVANGKYLVNILGCFHCHSKNMLKLDYVNAEHTNGYLEGGMKMKDDHKDPVRPSNLTPDLATGIGKYTKADLKKALTEGKALDGRTLHVPMPRFDHLADMQVNDIYAYLQSLHPVRHAVKHHA